LVATLAAGARVAGALVAGAGRPRRIAVCRSRSAGEGSAQRLGQAAAQVLERCERLGRAARRGQRLQVKPRQPFVQRMRQRQLLQVGDELAGPARGERQLGVVFDRAQPQLGEACDRGAGERGVGEVGQRGAAPQGERTGEPARRGVGAARVPAGPALGGQPLELRDVGGLGGGRQPVAGGQRVDPDAVARRQRAAQPGHQRVQGVARARRRPLAPDRVDQ
jgi:hypothetical protein